MVTGQIYFQHGGVESHYTWHVRQYSHECFPNLWLGCRPHVWSLRSPELPPLDYYHWSYLKTSVCERNGDPRAALLHYVLVAADHMCSHPDNIVSAT
jgi:hypothetical protein